MYLTKILNPRLYNEEGNFVNLDYEREILHLLVISLLNPLKYIDVLYRYDKDSNILIILSEKQIQYNGRILHFYNTPFNFKADSITTTIYENRVNSVQSGNLYKFYLETNPVSRSDGKDCKVVIGKESLFKWLNDKAKNKGFELVSDYFTPTSPRYIRCKNRQSLPVVEIYGLLRVTDLPLFMNTLLHGVGRHKAYGCGLLWIERS